MNRRCERSWSLHAEVRVSLAQDKCLWWWWWEGAIALETRLGTCVRSLNNGDLLRRRRTGEAMAGSRLIPGLFDRSAAEYHGQKIGK